MTGVPASEGSNRDSTDPADDVHRDESSVWLAYAFISGVVQCWGGVASWHALCPGARRALLVVRDLCSHWNLGSWPRQSRLLHRHHEEQR